MRAIWRGTDIEFYCIFLVISGGQFSGLMWVAVNFGPKRSAK